MKMGGLNRSTVEMPDAPPQELPPAYAERRSRLIGELDQLFRQAGDGAETRLLYQSLLEFRLDSPS